MSAQSDFSLKLIVFPEISQPGSVGLCVAGGLPRSVGDCVLLIQQTVRHSIHQDFIYPRGKATEDSLLPSLEAAHFRHFPSNLCFLDFLMVCASVGSLVRSENMPMPVHGCYSPDPIEEELARRKTSDGVPEEDEQENRAPRVAGKALRNQHPVYDKEHCSGFGKRIGGNANHSVDEKA